MPNWCESDLRVSIKDNKKAMEQLKQFKKFAVTKYGEDGQKLEQTNWLTTEKFIPYPEKFRAMDKKSHEAQAIYEAKKKSAGFEQMTQEKKDKWLKQNPHEYMKDGFNSGGYEWCCKNWGTKWGICNAELCDEDYKWGELTYSFDSAWSPPGPVIVAMSKMFPLLDFNLKYFEGGGGFNGWLECKGGKVLNDKQGDYFGDRGG